MHFATLSMASNLSVTPSESASNAPVAPTVLTVPDSKSTRGGRGGRGRRGRGGSRGGGPTPPSAIGSGIARPRHLSTTNTPTRDDPILIDEFTVSGADHLTPTQFLPGLALDHQGYISLAQSVYYQIVLADRSFSNRVPEPLFQLYCVSALWFRYLRLSVAFARREADNVVNLDRLSSIQWSLPDPIKRYLDSIGEFRAPSGDKYQTLSPLSWPVDTLVTGIGIPGHYGRVSATNFDSYVSYPSPYVSVYNTCAALARSLNIGNWNGDLPAALTPQTPPAGTTWTVTPNLSGFNPNLRLTSKQCSVLQNLGFGATNTGAQYSCDRFGFSGPTMSYVSSALGLTDGYKISSFDNLHSSGSLSLVPFLEVVDPSTDPSPSIDYLSSQLALEVKSSFDLDSRLSSGSLIMAFRVLRHRRTDDTAPSLPYVPIAPDGTEHAPPVAWSNRINANHVRGSSPRLNVEYFNTNPVVRRDILAEIARSFLKGKT